MFVSQLQPDVISPGKVPEGERLDVDAVARAVTAAVRPCFHEPNTVTIVAWVKAEGRVGM